MSTGVSTRHPPQEFPDQEPSVTIFIKTKSPSSPVVNDEIRERELMRVEEERRQAKSERRHPEVDHMRDPQRYRHIQQHHQRPHTQVDTRAREAREKGAEVCARRRETTASRNVPSTTVVQITEDGVAVDLGGEDLEDGRERTHLLR